jgi:hypothetical protein
MRRRLFRSVCMLESPGRSFHYEHLDSMLFIIVLHSFFCIVTTSDSFFQVQYVQAAAPVQYVTSQPATTYMYSQPAVSHWLAHAVCKRDALLGFRWNVSSPVKIQSHVLLIDVARFPSAYTRSLCYFSRELSNISHESIQACPISANIHTWKERVLVCTS